MEEEGGVYDTLIPRRVREHPSANFSMEATLYETSLCSKIAW